MIKIVRNALSKQVCDLMTINMDLLNKALGYPGDPTLENAFGYYSPIFLESLLVQSHELIEDVVKKRLYHTYSYGRIYGHDCVLPRHTDRPSSEWAVTCCLYKEDPWALHFAKDYDEVEVELNVGDICIYKGIEYPHWRDRYTGQKHVQAMLMYVDADGPYSDWALDMRESLCQQNECHKQLTTAEDMLYSD
tara:strand:- start:479 stop:1054 length:576 start_codon:yes stop_codon:yes gene_type:complete